MSFLTRVPRSLGQTALFHASLAATMVGLEVPPGSQEPRDQAVRRVEPDERPRRRRRGCPTTSSKDVGVDVKYGVTQNLTADFTYNTDFAQVEADEQQVNLTRFSLFFPEKREFFLENQGMFAFGGVGDDQRGRRHADSASTAGASASTRAAPCRSRSAAR